VTGSERTGLEGLVRRAGAHLRGAFETQGIGVERKSSSIDLVTRLDLETQEILQEGLHRLYPGEEVLAEEGAGERRRRSGSVWLVDPLDGTTNFVHGVPLFTVSVARVVDARPEVGCVYAPLLDEFYWASRGEGAQRQARTLRVSTCARLDDALLVTGFPYDIRTQAHNNLAEWSHLARRCRGLRRSGSAALDLAWVAAGRYDGYWEYRLAPWDLAAGALLVQEAGGGLTDPRGGEEFLWTGNVVATNGRLHDELLRELLQARRH
jgi:myo-inositol-1(or 4)-monophosphatase